MTCFKIPIRGCFGHALEIARPGQRVTWTNETTGVRYEMSPGADQERRGATCREKSSQNGVACQSQPGVWQAAQ